MVTLASFPGSPGTQGRVWNKARVIHIRHFMLVLQIGREFEGEIDKMSYMPIGFMH